MNKITLACGWFVGWWLGIESQSHAHEIAVYDGNQYMNWGGREEGKQIPFTCGNKKKCAQGERVFQISL